MAETRVDSQKIDLEKELYIHYHKQSYLDYKKSNNYQISVEWPIIAGIYEGAALAWRNKIEELSNVTEQDQQSLVEALGTINDIQTDDTYNYMAQEVVKEIKNMMDKSKKSEFLLNSDQSVEEKIQILDGYLENIHALINAYNKGNEDYLDYVLRNMDLEGQAQIKQLLASGEDTMSLININPTAKTAFKTLCNRVEVLEQASRILKSNPTRQSFQYKKKRYSYNSLLTPSRQLFVDILGGLGEGLGSTLGFTVITKALKDNADGKKVTVTIKGSGTEKGLTFKGVKKADYEIIIDKPDLNNPEASIHLSFGVSVKAQSLTKGKKITTTFESGTRLETLFAKYQMANNVEQYIFYNNLYHNMSGTEMYYLRKKMAAVAVCNGAVTGIHQGENVLFVQYLDSLISIDKFYEELSSSALSGNSKFLPTLNIHGIKKIMKQDGDFIKKHNSTALQDESYNDLSPDTKNLLAWARSREKLKALQSLSAAITYKHDLT